jgi:serine/threonine-protein kinase
LLARAEVYAQLGRHDDAEADLANAVRSEPANPEVWKERGRFRFARGQTDEATADFLKAVELLGDRVELTGPARSEADRLFGRLADEGLLRSLTAAVERDPNDVPRLHRRGEWYARHARWKEAAADFRGALERQPPKDHWQWYHAAPALLAAGDEEGYRWASRELLQRFADTQDPSTAERVAKACLLRPEAGEATALACRLAERSATVGKDHAYVNYFVFCKGLADYRRGDPGAAVGTLDSLIPRLAARQDVAAQAHAVLAMALHQQGKARAAREHLAEAARLIDLHKPEAGSPVPAYSHDWLIAVLLHREAEALLAGPSGT